MKKFVILFLSLIVLSCKSNIDCKIINYNIIGKDEHLNTFPTAGPFIYERYLILENNQKVIVSQYEYNKYKINDCYQIKECN